MLRGRDLLVIAGIWSWSLGSGMGIYLVVWHWGLVIWMGVLICWGLYLICGEWRLIAWLYISAAGSDILVVGRHLIGLGVVWKILRNRGWILIRHNMGFWISGAGIVVAGMI